MHDQEFSATADLSNGLSIAEPGDESRASIDLTAGFDSWLDYQAGRKSTAGQKVSHQRAMQIAAFWQGVTLVSGDVAKVPMDVYKRNGDDRSVDTTHPASQVMRWCANPDQSAFEWRRQMMIHSLVWGNAYSMIERNGRGDVTALYPLLPDRTECKTIDGEKVYRTVINNQQEFLRAYDVWHVKGISFDGKSGLDLIKYARDEIGKILARMNFASNFFKNGGRLGGILELPFSRNKRKLAKQEEGFRKMYEGNEAAFKTVVLRENAKFHAAQATFKDAQMADIGVEDARTVARLINIPPHKLGVPGVSSHNSLEQENKSYYNSSLSHHFCAFEAESWLKLFPKQTRKSGKYFFEHTIGALLWAESKTVAEIGTKGVIGGWLRPNEPRKWFNLNADPNGDSLLVPSGMVRASDSATDSDDLRSAVEKLVSETGSRFVKRLSVHARKAAKNVNAFERWLKTDFESHVDHGRGMFATVRDIQSAASGDSPDYARQIADQFRARLLAASNAGDDLNQIIGELSD